MIITSITTNIKTQLFKFSLLVMKYVDNVIFILDCCNPWRFAIPHAGYVQLNATTYNQNAYEVTVIRDKQDIYYGAFTYFLCKELRLFRDCSTLTYKKLIENISNYFSQFGINSQPQYFSSNSEDKLLFSISTLESIPNTTPTVTTIVMDVLNYELMPPNQIINVNSEIPLSIGPPVENK